MGMSSGFRVRNSKRGSVAGRNADPADRRRGVALIIVLGFLSIMIVMAVAFLTQARVERQVSDSTLEAMRGRQLLRTALHAAMNDYSVEMAKASLVMAPYDSDYDMFLSTPPKSLFGLSGRTIGEDNVNLLVGEVEDWIPRKYTNAPYLAKTNVPENAEWILVREDPSSPQPSRILGRYAYAIFDMSGGIDANLIARDPNIAEHDAQIASNRIRRSVRKVPMGLLPETADGSQFKSYRKGWKGFDSLYALIKLTDGYPNDGNAGSDVRWQPERKEGAAPAALHSNLVSDLTPFSLSVFRGGRYNPASASWTPYVLCGAQPWDNVLAPIASQFGAGWAGWIDDAINDYTNSASKIPNGTDYPSPKNVPMFNELNLTYRLVETPEPGPTGWSSYQLEVRLTPEFWYPFPSSDNKNAGTFNVPPPTVDGGPAPSGAAQVWFQIMMMPPLPVQFDPYTAPGQISVDAQYNYGKPYMANGTTNFTYMIPIVPMVTPSPPPPNPTYPLPSGRQLLINVVKIGQEIYLTGPGGNADMIPKDLLPSPSPVTLMPNAPAPAARVLEVTDPRLNHLPGQWVLQGTPTLGARNTWNSATEAKYLAEGTNMYCRNGPMETPAELGFIPSGKEWETIDLCTADAADVLANLVADTNLYKNWSSNKVINGATITHVFYTNGTINPNTRSSNVLATAFYELSSHEVPNVDPTVVGANPITDAQAGILAQSILDTTKLGTISTAFQTGSDWVRVPAMQKNGALSKLGLNNNQRESLLRNTWGLFSPDNSLFTVVVVSQAIKEAPASLNDVGIFDENFDTITGERRGVALVWRDPFKNGNNLHHEMFVRMFRYLND